MTTSTTSALGPLLYTVRRCALGQALVAASEQGVVAVLLGDEKTALIDDLQARFPGAALDTGGAALHRWSDAVLDAIERPSTAPAVPLDVRVGSAFQRTVWQALQAIPPGDTRSYQAVAQAIGRPQAARAVATACAANPVAVLVPCHRVLRSDGGLGGYRWGLERKQQLLQREAAERAGRV